MVQAHSHQGDGNVCGREPYEEIPGSSSEGNNVGYQRPTKQTSGPSTDVWPKSLDELLYQYPCCPPDAFFNVREFYDNKYLNHYDDTSKKVRVAVRNYCCRIREWSVGQFHEYYSKPEVKPYFNAYARDAKQVYYDLETSVQIADELLMYQFNDDRELVCKFLQDVYDVCNKTYPKRNSMVIHSPPSAGKNFFFDAVASYFLNYGMFGTANKTNNFSWADGAGKRIVLWNEPNYEQFHIEKIKELLGGDTTRIHVKYKGDQPLQGPPIFLLTNNFLNIMTNPAFADRLIKYDWCSAPLLKKYTRKLYPLFFYELLIRNNIRVE